jgi:hypothetical protein
MYSMSTYGTWVAVAVAVATGACSDEAPPLGKPGVLPQVVTRTDPATAAQCPDGGSVVSAGLDHNEDGALDSTEVRSTTVLCNEAPVVEAPSVVVRLVAEPAGAHCIDGGTAVQVGPDRNRNGELDDDEVTHTDYVCGVAPLTRLVPEPAGPHCVAGGIAFLTGRDLDADRELDDDEVEHIEYSCGDILARSVTVRSRTELETLARIRVIQGSLDIRDPDLGPDGSLDEISLPELEEVRTLTISDVKLATRISLPQLLLVASAVRITDNSLLVTLDLPRLSRAGSLDVSRNPALATLTGLPNLGRIPGELTVGDNVALATVQTFAASGNIHVHGNPSLTALVVFPSAATPLIRIGNNGLRTLHISAPEDLSGTLSVGRVQISDNPQLDRVLIDASRLGALVVTRNALLDEVTLFADQVHGDVTFTSNPRLDQLSLLSQRSFGATAIAGSLTVEDPISSLSSGLVIGRDLTLDGTQLIDLFGIRRVGGTLRVRHNLQLREALGRLVLGGGLELVDNPLLANLFLFQQDAVNGNLVISQNPKLVAPQSLLSIRTVLGDVSIHDNASLFSTDLFSLTTVEGTLDISNNPALPTSGLLLGKLVHVERIRLHDNAALAQISLPVLSHAPEVVIEDNAALLHVALPVLTEASSLTISHNHQLPTCEVLALFEQITAASKQQVDNDDAAVCAR